nr:hypothetical protein DWUX_206 [Desulfovibrio diazotrophicus]
MASPWFAVARDAATAGKRRAPGKGMQPRGPGGGGYCRDIYFDRGAACAYKKGLRPCPRRRASLAHRPPPKEF